MSKHNSILIAATFMVSLNVAAQSIDIKSNDNKKATKEIPVVKKESPKKDGLKKSPFKKAAKETSNKQ